MPFVGVDSLVVFLGSGWLLGACLCGLGRVMPAACAGAEIRVSSPGSLLLLVALTASRSRGRLRLISGRAPQADMDLVDRTPSWVSPAAGIHGAINPAPHRAAKRSGRAEPGSLELAATARQPVQNATAGARRLTSSGSAELPTRNPRTVPLLARSRFPIRTNARPQTRPPRDSSWVKLEYIHASDGLGLEVRPCPFDDFGGFAFTLQRQGRKIL